MASRNQSIAKKLLQAIRALVSINYPSAVFLSTEEFATVLSATSFTKIAGEILGELPDLPVALTLDGLDAFFENFESRAIVQLHHLIENTGVVVSSGASGDLECNYRILFSCEQTGRTLSYELPTYLPLCPITTAECAPDEFDKVLRCICDGEPVSFQL